MFKVGDKVRRKPEFQNDSFWLYSIGMNANDGAFTVSDLTSNGDIKLEEVGAGAPSFAKNCFELNSSSIQVGDVYKTKNGRSVRIICTDAKFNETPIIGLATIDVGKEMLMYFKADGTTLSDNYLVLPWNQAPKTDWSKVATDTLIKIINIDGYRYFSHYINDKVWYYAAGTTSRTYTDILPVGSEYCELIEETK